jgi:hypothetical protein
VNHPEFELLMFSTDPDVIRPAVAAGIDGVVVDWEWRGKDRRQENADTEINRATVEDLRRVRACTPARVSCRINGFGPETASEVARAVGEGADELLLPMVRDPGEVERVLGWANGHCAVGILVETPEAVARAEELASLPISRVYVGLNDLGIARRTPNIFSAAVDGLVEELRGRFRAPFGFGGLTLPDRGTPISCKLLIGEMARLECSHTFLRRSFHRDMRGRDPAVEVPRLRQALALARQRTAAEVHRDRSAFVQAVRSWRGHLFPPIGTPALG